MQQRRDGHRYTCQRRDGLLQQSRVWLPYAAPYAFGKKTDISEGPKRYS